MCKTQINYPQMTGWVWAKYRLINIQLSYLEKTGWERKIRWEVYFQYLSFSKMSLSSVCMLSLSRVQLSVTPRTVAHQAPLSMGFSRQEYWNGPPCPPPGDLPHPGTEPTSLHLLHCQEDSLPLSHLGSPEFVLCSKPNLWYAMCEHTDPSVPKSSLRAV